MSALETDLERCARAIYDEAERQRGGYVGAYRFPRLEGEDTCLDGEFNLAGFARAALTALREPSEGMIRRGEDVIADMDDNGIALYCRAASETFQAMIDHALTEKG